MKLSYLDLDRLIEDVKSMEVAVDETVGRIPTYEEVGKIFLSRRSDVIKLALLALKHIDLDEVCFKCKSYQFIEEGRCVVCGHDKVSVHSS